MLLFVFSCGKKNDTPANPCAGITITVSATTTSPATGSSNGSIVATATGATGFTYSLNGGAYQSTGFFSGLSAGTYTITAKSNGGCTGSQSFTLNNAVNCATVTINVNPTTTGVIPCVTASGTITAAASGGVAPYTYSINGGSFQSAASFSNLNAGTYTIAAKDANGCTGTQTGIVVGTQSPGSLFLAVRSIIQTNCVSCHNATVAQGGVNLNGDCNIVSAKERIRARAVEGNPSPMPATGLLPAADRQAITNWINAGGRVID